MQIRFWVKAFIPESIYSASGQEITWRANTGCGESMSMLPLQSYFPSLSASYATDQRSFSSHPDASARITTLICIPANENNEITVMRYSDPTLQLRKSWMALFTFQDGSIESLTSRPGGNQSIAQTENTLTISFSTHGSNPFFSVRGLNYAPPISMNFTLSIQTSAEEGMTRISLEGKVSQFPAFEAYIQIDNQQPVAILRHEPKKGHTPYNLIYGANQSVKGSTDVPGYHCARLFAVKNKISSIEAVKSEKNRIYTV